MATNRDQMTSLRLTGEEFVVLRGAALAEGKALSEFIRESALERALAPAEPRRTEER